MCVSPSSETPVDSVSAADRRSERMLSWTIFLVSLFIFMVRQGARPEFLQIDSRFGLFVHEMMETGEYLWPMLYGKAYPDYLGLPTFLSMCVAFLTGKVDCFSLVFPSAAAGALLVLLTWKIGCRFFDHRIAFTAVLLLFGSFEFVSIGRIFSLDLYPAVVTAAGVWLTCTGISDKKERRVYWTLPLLILGYLTRGPIGAVVPTAVVCGILLLERRYARMFVFALWAGVITVTLFALWGAAIYFYGGTELFNECVYMQVTHRLAKGRPIWYFFADAAGSFAFTYPAAMIVIAVSIWNMRKRLLTDPALRPLAVCIAWFLIVAGGFSIPGTKHLRYVCPLMPAAALLAAHLFWNVFRSKVFRFVRKVFFVIAGILPFFSIPLLIGTQFVLGHPWIVEKIGCRIDLPWFSGCIILLLFDIVLLLSKRQGRYRRLCLLGVVCGIVVFVRVMILEPIEDQTLGSRDFVLKSEIVRGSAPLYFLGLGPDGDENKYMINIKRSAKFIPAYLSVEEVLGKSPRADLKSGTFMVVRLDRWKRLPESYTKQWQELVYGKVGRRKTALLKKY